MEAWIISVSGQAYGPYSTAQMEAFAVEGRLAPHSLVAQPGDKQFRAAGDEPALSAFFKPSEFAPQPATTISATVGNVPSTAQAKSQEAAAGKFGRQADENRDGELTRFIVMTDLKSGSITGIEEELFRLGPCCTVFPQVWVVQSELTASGIKNLLIQKLGKLDTLFVVDATHDKAAWFNFSPESETRIRRIWSKTPEPAAKRKAG